MNWTKLSVVTTLAAALIASPATAYADAVPNVDEIVAIMAELTDPNIPAANKGNVVTPGLSPDEAGTTDDHLNQMNGRGLLPLHFVVSDIQPAPNNFAGATLATDGSYNQVSKAKPIVLVNQGGHWLITHETAMTALDAYWQNANRSPIIFAPHWHPIGWSGGDDPAAAPPPPPGDPRPLPLPVGSQGVPPGVEVYCPNLPWIHDCQRCVADPAHQCWNR